MDATPNKSKWDKRAWTIGLFWGNLFGIISAITGYPPIEHRLVAIFPVHSSFMKGGEAFSMVFGLVGLLILPGILSGIAYRKPFLWGLLPLGLFYFWIEVESIFDKPTISYWKDAALGLVIILAAWVLIPGPISLYRYSKVRAERKRLTMQALFDAQREAMSVEQPGVWPPPPNYTGENRS